MANSREHRVKRSDLVREHGRGGYQDDAILSRITGESRSVARSSKSRSLSFEPSMCEPCNNQRSQPFDRAYDQLIERVWASEARVLADRELDLVALWAAEHVSRGEQALRYFVKHICCRIAELATLEQPAVAPRALIDFLDGGPMPPVLGYRFHIEAVQLRIEAAKTGHPLDARIFGFDALWAFGGGAYSSAWRYGWLTLLWWIGADAPDGHHLAQVALPLPIVATQFDVGFEFALAAPPPATDATVPEGPSMRGAHMALRTSRSFLAGLLDTGSALDGRAIDDRRNTYDGLVEETDFATERVRAGQLARAAAVWAQGRLDRASTEEAMRGQPGGLAELHALASSLQELTSSDDPAGSLPLHFAGMSILALAKALAAPAHAEEAGEWLLEATRLAGCCLAASARAAEQPEVAFALAVVGPD